MPALVIGFIAGVVCYLMVAIVKQSSATTILSMPSASTARRYPGRDPYRSLRDQRG